MRLFALVAVALLAGCSSSRHDADAAATDEANLSERIPASADQRAAHSAAAQYLADIGKRDFGTARTRWANDGSAAGGTKADLGRAYAGYATLTLNAGEAGPVSTTGDVARAVVPVTGEGVVKKTGEKIILAGNIYLQRTRGGDAAGATPESWRIWAADIRRQH